MAANPINVKEKLEFISKEIHRKNLALKFNYSLTTKAGITYSYFWENTIIPKGTKCERCNELFPEGTKMEDISPFGNVCKKCYNQILKKREKGELPIPGTIDFKKDSEEGIKY